MRVALIHNPKAGGDDQPDCEDLLEFIRAAGHEVKAHSSKDDYLAALLDEAPDLVAIAGGDGTIGKVVKIMLGRGIPLAALPTGTANNISRTLGIADIPIEKQIRGWSAWSKAALNVGLARGPWGASHFVEAVGAGLLAWIIPKAESSAILAQIDDAPKKVAYARRMLEDRLTTFPAVAFNVTLDGKDISGKYLLFEAMNTRFVGPNLELAPESDPGDGLLDIVLVPGSKRNELRAHLARGKAGTHQPPKLPTHRGRELMIEWNGCDLHFDDDVWPGDQPVASESKTIDVKLEDEAVEFLSPRRHATGA
jgi:diacylglycerol kinase (ATP)